MNIRKTILAAAATLLLAAGIGTAKAHPHDIVVNDNDHGQIHIDDRTGDVVITAEDDSQARITRDGGLIITGKNIAVTAGQRQLLLQYVHGIDTIEHQGMEIGAQAVNMVGGMVGAIIGDLFTDGSDKHVDRDVKDRARPLKDAARSLCTTVQSQEQVQDAIAREIPAFKPYAVIDKDTRDQCHIDNDDED